MKLYSRLCRFLLVLFLLLRFTPAHADTLSKAQIHVLNQAYAAGEPYGLGRTLQAVVLQESSAGADRKRRDKKSFGLGQVRVATARLFEQNTSAADLLKPDTNLRIASKYLAYCKNRFHNWRRAVFAYHWGAPKASKASDSEVNADPYVNAVIARYWFLQSISTDTK